MKKPKLGGRLVVQFTISPTGQVTSSVLQSSTVGDAKVETCIVDTVRRWEFSKPEGGKDMIVSYPFLLTPAAAGG